MCEYMKCMYDLSKEEMYKVFIEVRDAYLKEDILNYIEDEEIIDESEFDKIDLNWIVEKCHKYDTMDYSKNIILQLAIESYFDLFGDNFSTYNN